MKVRKGVTELQDVTITHVSYVKRGANKRQFLLSKSENGKNPDIEFEVKVVRKENDPQKLLYGIVYEPDEVDAHGDVMKAEEIEKMAHEFIEHYRNIDKEHDLKAGMGSVVESYIVQQDTTIGKSTVKAGSWILVTKATDEIWEQYLNGDITGYSMFGIARKTIAKTDDVRNVSAIQKALEKLGIVKSFEETLDEIVNDMKTDPFFIMSIMEEEFWKNISWDTTRKEDLIILSTAMKEAANYIDGIVGSIQKSNVEEEQNETIPESQGGDVPDENSKPVDNAEDNEDNQENENNDNNAGEDENANTDDELELKKALELKDQQILELAKNLAEKDAELETFKNKQIIKSAVTERQPITIQKNNTPNFF